MHKKKRMQSSKFYSLSAPKQGIFYVYVFVAPTPDASCQ